MIEFESRWKERTESRRMLTGLSYCLFFKKPNYLPGTLYEAFSRDKELEDATTLQ